MVCSGPRLGEVQGDGGKLLGGAALQEQDLVVVRDGHQLPQVRLSFLDDARELWAPASAMHGLNTPAGPVRAPCPASKDRAGLRSRVPSPFESSATEWEQMDSSSAFHEAAADRLLQPERRHPSADAGMGVRQDLWDISMTLMPLPW